MSNPQQEQLLGHLLGALDEQEDEQFSARLNADPELKRELELMGARMEILEIGRRDFSPPRGLAERTCQYVASHAARASAPRRQPMALADGAPSSPSRFRWTDVAVAAAVFLVAALLTPPAIQSSRFNADLATCQGNLGQIGLGMLQYSERHEGYFPGIPKQGKLAVAGIYAPLLVSGGFVPDSNRFVCPGSALKNQKGFRVPSLSVLNSASQEKLDEMVQWLGGSYGYDLGYIRDGDYVSPRNQGRGNFALAADLPGSDLANGRQSPNHGGRGQNVLFETGVVRFVTSPHPNPQADDIFANDWGLVAPGLHEKDSVIGPGYVRPIVQNLDPYTTGFLRDDR